MQRLTALAFAMLAVIQAPQKAQSAPPNASVAGETQLQSRYDAMVKSVTTKDLALATSLYDLNAILLPPKGKALSGIGEVRAYFRKSFSMMRVLRETLTPTRRIAANGVVVDIVYLDGDYVLNGQKEVHHAKGKMLYVWQQGIDGTWRLTRDMWNSI